MRVLTAKDSQHHLGTCCRRSLLTDSEYLRTIVRSLLLMELKACSIHSCIRRTTEVINQQVMGPHFEKKSTRFCSTCVVFGGVITSTKGLQKDYSITRPENKVFDSCCARWMPNKLQISVLSLACMEIMPRFAMAHSCINCFGCLDTQT